MSSEQQEHHRRSHLEIWSTRVQRELLALTTTEEGGSEELTVTLPSFCSIQNHELNLEQGVCVVTFDVHVENVPQYGKDELDAPPTTGTVVIVVSLDASLPRTATGQLVEDASSAPVYPFAPPVASLVQGQEAFPPGSTLQVGDVMDLGNLDWTPSLHLSDAILNLALLIKESLLQSEPFHPATAVDEEDPIEELKQGAQRIKESISKASTSLSKAFSPMKKKQHSEQQQPQSRAKPMLRKKAITVTDHVEMGQEINLLEEPWVDAHGVYQCKAIRRPAFVEEIMAQVQLSKQSGAESFGSPTAMFRSLTKSAKSVLEESFLMITETHILEIKSSKINLSTGTVVFGIPIEMLGKLKFRRQESISLFFKSAPDDPLIYLCPDAGDAVHQIQTVLKRHGVKGQHTNAAAHRAIAEALSLVQEIQTKELALKHDPTVERVNEIMDLYRQAAERFEVAGDVRHEEVVTHMRKFLALPLTTSILDGTYTTKMEESIKSPCAASGSNGIVPEGEVLERSPAILAEDDTDEDHNQEREKENDKLFHDNMDNLLKEAQQDLEQFKLDTGDGNDTVETAKRTLSADSGDGGGIGDLSADLDAMMKQADEELAALMDT